MDKYLRYALEILFHRTSPVNILRSFVDSNIKDYSYVTAFDKEFESHMRQEYSFLSPDEISYSTSALKRYCDDENYKNCGVFTAIFKFAQSTLWEQNGEPCVKFDKLLCFRDTTHSIGPDFFICSYLAEIDYRRHNKKRLDFDYPTSIKTDNIRLHNMLRNGMAENHFHLKGSTPAFTLSWICLMNNVKNRKPIFDKINLEETSLNSDMLFRHNQGNVSYYNLVMKAAAIRLFLSKLIRKSIDAEETELKELINFLSYDDIEISANINKLQREIDIYQRVNSNKIDKYNSYMDYAIDSLHVKNKPCIVFTGERKFLYNMFYAIISGDKDVKPYIELFYTYVLISSWFRGELVQNNNNTGFANFEEYQNRKEIFIEGYKAYENALVAIALESNLVEESIKSIEARFVPKKQSKDIREQIALFDRLAKISKESDSVSMYISKRLKQEARTQLKNRHFYVVHFPKSKDEKFKELTCRHFSLRRKIKVQALSIAYIREKQFDAAYRILGIDACANEIGCRPEVFAQPFRFLKNHQVKRDLLNIDKELPQQLRITYHAGEDFLDVPDGLRAIDEALQFLNMTPGDRLGHALALGIDVEKWYMYKKRRIIIPRQDLIDNVAWMIFKLQQFNYMDSNFIYELKSIYKENFLYVYQRNLPFQERDHFIDESIYIDSWMLRGDDPYLYINCIDHVEYEQKIRFGYLYPNFKYNYFSKNCPEDAKLEAIRRSNMSAYKLLHHYHFNEVVRRFGEECIELEISSQYIKAVAFIQEKMRYEIAQKGIGIECNPSSNYLIGTFKRYDQHPIVNFNNHGLIDNDKSNPKMFISINTDDLGVFDTSLENEYALIACALQKAEDEDGNKKYSPNDIYDYLDYIRKMGIEQSFAYDILRKNSFSSNLD